MSTAPREWDFTVPDDDAELLSELRRHGVRAGQRLRVIEMTPVEQGPPRSERRTKTFAFIASGEPGPADLSERTDDYLGEGFGLD